MIIGNFSQLDLRLDKWALWENFLISERLKQNTYKDTFSKMYFWRTKQQQEIDLVEEKNEEIFGFEFKWKNRKIKIHWLIQLHFFIATLAGPHWRRFVISGRK